MQGSDLIKVSVAIPTYNRADFLRETLAGVVAQQFPRDQFEVLVIDNNSRDHTRAVVAEFAGRHPPPRYLHEPRQGVNHARNRALVEARGEILVFADDDILVPAHWLAHLVAPFLADREGRIGAVGGEVIPVFPDGLPEWIRGWHAPLAFRRDTGHLDPRHSPMGANLAFRREVLASLGPFSSGLGRQGNTLLAGEETEMLRRLRAAGFAVWFSPTAAVRHQMPAVRTTFRYTVRHAFDSARSRVIARSAQSGAAGFLYGRLIANVFKAIGFSAVALFTTVVVRPGAAKQALVRAWRSCGYIYQITRTLSGKT